MADAEAHYDYGLGLYFDGEWLRSWFLSPFFPTSPIFAQAVTKPIDGVVHGWSDVWTDRTDKDWKWAPRPRHLWRHYIRTQFSYAKWFLMSYCLAFESLVVDQKKETCLFSSVSRFFFFCLRTSHFPILLLVSIPFFCYLYSSCTCTTPD